MIMKKEEVQKKEKRNPLDDYMEELDRYEEDCIPMTNPLSTGE